MKKRKMGWLVLGIISSISAIWTGVRFAGMLLFLLFIRSSGIIDDQSFGGDFTNIEIGAALYFIAIIVLSVALAIFSIYKFNTSAK